jgi:hypothetical protein
MSIQVTYSYAFLLTNSDTNYCDQIIIINNEICNITN